MKRWGLIMSVCVMVLTCVSCQRRPFADHTTKVNIVLKINTKIVNMGEDEVPIPEMMRVDFCDTESGIVLVTDWVGPEGGIIHAPPGDYDLIVYNDQQTESTLVRDDDNFNSKEAYTNEVSEFLKSQFARFMRKRAELRQMSAQEPDVKADDEKIVNQPDHLFVGRVRGVNIPAVYGDEYYEKVVEIHAESVVETWVAEIVNVEGLEWVSSIVAMMSGQVESTLIGPDIDSDNSVTVFFEMDKDEAAMTMRGRFNTFGKHPSVDNALSFDLNITDTGGGEHFYHFDVTDDFDNNPDFHIVVDEEIVIEEPKVSGGGFDPKVEDWQDVQTDIKL